MSYCFDVLSKAWNKLSDQLPPDVRDGELATYFGFMLEELHEANHRLRDAVNHDARVTKHANKLDQALLNGKEAP